MQCPRCGTDNPPGITACIRCGLPAYPADNPYTAQPGRQPLTPPPGRSARAGSTLAALAAVVSAAAALASLGYGIFAVTARRGLYADIAADAASVTSSDARSSDTLNAVLLWLAVAMAILAVALWVVSMVSVRRGAGGIGVTGLGLVLIAAALAITGAVRVSGVGSASEAGAGGSGYVLVGSGFLLMAVGLLLGIVALRRPVAGTGGTTPYAQGPYGNQYAPYQTPPGASQP